MDIQIREDESQRAERKEMLREDNLKFCLHNAQLSFDNEMYGYSNESGIDIPLASPKGIALANILKNNQNICLERYKK